MSLDIEWIGSPNFAVGRRGFKPEAIVIHIMEGTLAGTDSWFRNRSSGVSAHYGVGLAGELHQYVEETDTAWHAGRKSSNAPWRGLKPRTNPNLYTIGIEHEGRADDAWPESMYGASAALIAQICLRWDIPIDRTHIVGHREIYTAKTCPGSRVSLAKLIRQASARAVDSDTFNLVRQPGTVTVRRGLRIREQAPTTRARKLRTAVGGSRLSYVGWTSNGQSVAGNPHWYKDPQGNYFWAGGTTAPIPGLG